MSWDDVLRDASYGGVRLDVRSVRDRLGRTLDKRAYPNRNGTEIDDRARDGAVTTWRVEILEDDYPDTLHALIRMWREGGIRAAQHPLLGTFQAAIESLDVVHDADEGAGATVDLTLAEHTDNALGPFESSSIASIASQVRSAADDVDVARAALVEPAALAQTPNAETAAAAASLAGDATTTAVATIDELEALDEPTSIDVTNRMNVALAAIASSQGALGDLTTIEVHALHRSLTALAARLGDFAAAMVERLPPLTEETVDDAVSLLVWVHRRYGNSARVDELLALNTIPNPLRLDVGQRLRCYAR